ncbi:hypothetical protein [Streptomyces sp. NPDC050704]|uniref:hypothetical protein n=1 Tax=Streptomyces sp. NPDC050704 TaxID=3157219 RepID=UPI003421314C
MGFGTAVLLTTGGMATAVAQDGSSSQGGNSVQEDRAKRAHSKANAKFGYAHASWKWAGPGSTGKVKVYVNDQRCRDDYDTFAFMQFKNAWGGVVDGDARVWNYNDDCKGKGITKKIAGYSGNFNITKGRVVVCKNDAWWWDDDTCKKGKWTKNPKG